MSEVALAFGVGLFVGAVVVIAFVVAARGKL